MGCHYNPTDGFSIFVKTKVLPREEVNRQAGVYKNFLNKDGTPKSRNRHVPAGEYTLTYHQNKIKDKRIKDKFQKIRQHIKSINPKLTEEYTKKRVAYWNNSNQCIYTIEPRRKALWLGVAGKRDLSDCKKYFDHNKTFFKITNKVKLENILKLTIN